MSTLTPDERESLSEWIAPGNTWAWEAVEKIVTERVVGERDWWLAKIATLTRIRSVRAVREKEAP
jgi:hypothetical protein